MSDLKSRAKEIFLKALDQSGDLPSFIAGACGDDEELQQRVQELLDAHHQAGDFLAPSRADATAPPSATPDNNNAPTIMPTPAAKASSFIGPYKLLQQIGEGGMGAVWMAEQEKPVKRRVALKLIRADMGSKEIVARFEAERQALAMMDHPNIARVLDAGTTEQGSPYFVMELVKGIPLNEFCDQNKLTVRERLELFIPICNALQHAHQKGIIHRDLKPSNVLVTLQDGVPLPKVIDFGLAKALEHTHKLTDKTLFTEFGKVVGTLQYMSPEQAEMNVLDVDTRTDIYSLGVMLYELLAGSTPIAKESLHNNAMLQVLAMIRETDPPLPSVRMSSSGDAATGISAQRKIAPAKLQQILKGDLDWMVMKAIDKDRPRRYETANGFAMDIQRYLDGEPVTAAPPSTTYRMRKFISRNRAGVIAASAIAIALVAGVIGTSTGMIWALNEKGRADEQAALATASAEAEKAASRTALANEKKAIAATSEAKRELERATEIKSLITQMLTSVNPEIARQADTTLLKAILADAAKRLNDGEIRDKLVAAELHFVVGETYHWLDENAAAEPHIKKALEIRKQELVPTHRDTLITKNRLATYYERTNRLADAETLYEEILPIMKEELGEENIQTLGVMTNLVVTYAKQGRFAECETLAVETLKIAKPALGEDSKPARITLSTLANVYAIKGQLDKAEPLFKKLIELLTRVNGEDSPETLGTVANLAKTYSLQNRHEETLKLLKPRLSLVRNVMGQQREFFTPFLGLLAKSYVEVNELDEARSLCQEILESLASELEEADASLLFLYSAATALTYEEIPEVWDPTRALGYAERLCEKAESLGVTHQLWDYQNVLALAQHQTGDTAAAIESQRRAISALAPHAPERSQYEKRLAEYEAALTEKDKETPSEATADDATSSESDKAPPATKDD